jgi:hypothetical protein
VSSTDTEGLDWWMRTNGEEGTGAGNQAPPTDFAGSSTGQPIEHQGQAVGRQRQAVGTGGLPARTCKKSAKIEIRVRQSISKDRQQCSKHM